MTMAALMKASSNADTLDELLVNNQGILKESRKELNGQKKGSHILTPRAWFSDWMKRKSKAACELQVLDDGTISCTPSPEETMAKTKVDDNATDVQIEEANPDTAPLFPSLFRRKFGQENTSPSQGSPSANDKTMGLASLITPKSSHFFGSATLPRRSAPAPMADSSISLGEEGKGEGGKPTLDEFQLLNTSPGEGDSLVVEGQELVFPKKQPSLLVRRVTWSKSLHPPLPQESDLSDLMGDVLTTETTSVHLTLSRRTAIFKRASTDTNVQIIQVREASTSTKVPKKETAIQLSEGTFDVIVDSVITTPPMKNKRKALSILLLSGWFCRGGEASPIESSTSGVVDASGTETVGEEEQKGPTNPQDVLPSGDHADSSAHSSYSEPPVESQTILKRPMGFGEWFKTHALRHPHRASTSVQTDELNAPTERDVDTQTD